MEGKAKAEQDSLTQAEEENTSVHTAQIAAVSACALTGAHWRCPDNQGRRAFGRARKWSFFTLRSQLNVLPDSPQTNDSSMPALS
eukprot:scaffold75317_cov50-Phaeocystis_antarctica.AAC.2